MGKRLWAQQTHDLKAVLKDGKTDKENGRSDRIRTCDVLAPNQALYQAELRSVEGALLQVTTAPRKLSSPTHRK